MRGKKTYGLICLSAPGHRPVPRYCLPVARCQGSESIFTCDSRILLGSVSVTSGEKVNWGPKDAALYGLFPVRGHGPPHILRGLKCASVEVRGAGYVHEKPVRPEREAFSVYGQKLENSDAQKAALNESSVSLQGQIIFHAKFVHRIPQRL